jgi:hypothetical protein
MGPSVEWYHPAGPDEQKGKQFRLSDAGLKPDEHGNVKIHPVYAVVNQEPGGWRWYVCDKSGPTNVTGTQATLERAQWEAEQAHEARSEK